MNIQSFLNYIPIIPDLNEPDGPATAGIDDWNELGVRVRERSHNAAFLH